MVAIQLTNVSKSWGKKKVIDNLSFAVEENSICGFLGLNGAGKTTTFKLLNSLIPPDSGDISLFGQPIDKKQPSKDIKFLQDVPTFYAYMTAYEYLAFICDINELENKSNRIEETLELVGMTDAAKRRIGTFSRGMKQRIGIGANMISNPKILLLDEPVSALDPIGRKDIFNLLEKLRGKMTILFSSHIIEDIERVSDKIIVIHEGKKVMDGTVNEIKENFPAVAIEIVFLSGQDKESFLSKNQYHTIEGDTEEMIRIKAEHIPSAQKEIFSFLAKESMEIKSFRVLSPSLEEIFVGSVKP